VTPPPPFLSAPFLFDLDGTLADTLPDIAASVNHVRSRHSLAPLALAVVRNFVGDGARTLVARALAEVLPDGAVARERALDLAFAEYGTHHGTQCTVHAKWFPGVREHLELLRARGHGLAVVTNKPERFARAIVQHLGAADVFGALVGGDTLPQKKPDPAPVRHALALLGWRGGGATIVGDGVQDLRAGKAAGVRTIACLFGYGSPAKLKEEGADEYWSAFGVVAG